MTTPFILVNGDLPGIGALIVCDRRLVRISAAEGIEEAPNQWMAVPNKCPTP
jgi:hypothetical protein